LSNILVYEHTLFNDSHSVNLLVEDQSQLSTLHVLSTQNDSTLLK